MHVQDQFDVAKISFQMSSKGMDMKHENFINATGLVKLPLPSSKSYITLDPLFMTSADQIVQKQSSKTMDT